MSVLLLPPSPASPPRVGIPECRIAPSWRLRLQRSRRRIAAENITLAARFVGRFRKATSCRRKRSRILNAPAPATEGRLGRPLIHERRRRLDSVKGIETLSPSVEIKQFCDCTHSARPP